MVTWLHVTLLAAVPFGPFGSAKHPLVGPAAPVPGSGPEAVVSQAPEEIPLAKVKQAKDTRGRAGSNPLFLLFLVYKDFLTKVDGNRCQHYPTCSSYGAQAVGRHNVLGVFMAIDRLWASGNSSSVRSDRLVYGIGPTPRFYDPVEDSTFFFNAPLAAWIGRPIPDVDAARGRTADAPESDDTAPTR